MNDMLKAVLGEYVPVTYEQFVSTTDGGIMVSNVIPSGVSGLDFNWIVNAVVFLGMLYLLYKVFYLLIPINKGRR